MCILQADSAEVRQRVVTRHLTERKPQRKVTSRRLKSTSSPSKSTKEPKAPKASKGMGKMDGMGGVDGMDGTDAADVDFGAKLKILNNPTGALDLCEGPCISGVGDGECGSGLICLNRAPADGPSVQGCDGTDSTFANVCVPCTFLLPARYCNF